MHACVSGSPQGLCAVPPLCRWEGDKAPRRWWPAHAARRRGGREPRTPCARLSAGAFQAGGRCTGLIRYRKAFHSLSSRGDVCAAALTTGTESGCGRPLSPRGQGRGTSSPQKKRCEPQNSRTPAVSRRTKTCLLLKRGARDSCRTAPIQGHESQPRRSGPRLCWRGWPAWLSRPCPDPRPSAHRPPKTLGAEKSPLPPATRQCALRFRMTHGRLALRRLPPHTGLLRPVRATGTPSTTTSRGHAWTGSSDHQCRGVAAGGEHGPGDDTRTTEGVRGLWEGKGPRSSPMTQWSPGDLACRYQDISGSLQTRGEGRQSPQSDNAQKTQEK